MIILKTWREMRPISVHCKFSLLSLSYSFIIKVSSCYIAIMKQTNVNGSLPKNTLLQRMDVSYSFIY